MTVSEFVTYICFGRSLFLKNSFLGQYHGDLAIKMEWKRVKREKVSVDETAAVFIVVHFIISFYLF